MPADRTGRDGPSAGSHAIGLAGDWPKGSVVRALLRRLAEPAAGKDRGGTFLNRRTACQYC